MVIFNDETFEERLIFRLTRLNVLSVVISLSIIFTLLTFLLIMYSPVKEYIPGYPSVEQHESLIKLNILADSLQMELQRKDVFFENIKNIVEEKVFDEQVETRNTEPNEYENITLKKSVHDSLLRAEFETRSLHNLYISEPIENIEKNLVNIKNLLFYSPVEGIVTSKFDLRKDHFGIDIVAKHNSAIKAVLDGTVVFAGWTLETGYIIAIQHQQNLVSFYKHNSVLLKKQGEIVSSGEPIAITGESGEISTGPHLHFELWHNGVPVDPENYIMFN